MTTSAATAAAAAAAASAFLLKHHGQNAVLRPPAMAEPNLNQTHSGLVDFLCIHLQTARAVLGLTCKVEPFSSFTTGLHEPSSDIGLSVLIVMQDVELP